MSAIIGVGSAFGIAYFPPPLKQISNGTPAENVTCTEGLELVFKIENNLPACVKPSSVTKLVSRGWASQTMATDKVGILVETNDVTLADNNKTFEITSGDRLVLKLGEQYNWEINIDNMDVLSRVKNIMVIRGSQGVFESKMTGTAVLEAQGDPICLQETPQCGMPSILFKITVHVS